MSVSGIHASRAGSLLGRRRLSKVAGTQSRSSQAFVFDIDGVLTLGKNPLDAGRRAMRELMDPAGSHFQYPVMFLTNGGGMTEDEKAKEVSQLTGASVSAEQVVLSHTPMKDLAAKYNYHRDKVVGVVGKRGCVSVASSYGFERVIALEDFARLNPTVTPNTDQAQTCAPPNEALAGLGVAAVLIMHESRNWGRDIQLLCDILGSDGGPSRSPSAEQVVSLYASNADFIYPNEYSLPRLAQGAFHTALQAVFERRFGRPLQINRFGKPERSQFQFIEPKLYSRARLLGFEDIDAIYMIGDNPEADIRGANAAGGKWTSVLVRTGCFNGSDNDPDDPADLVVDDAHRAVLAALEGRKKT